VRSYIRRHSSALGQCDYCKHRRVRLIEVNQLTPYFEGMAQRFRYDDSSSDRLIDLAQGYEIFSQRLAGETNDGAVELFDDILKYAWDDDDGDQPFRGEDYYSTRSSEWHETAEEQWLEYSEWVKSGQAPHVVGQLEDEDGILRDIVDTPAGSSPMFDEIGRIAVSFPPGTPLFRALPDCNADGSPFAGARIGAPPVHLTKEQRASRKGEVVFYCATDESTAIAEARTLGGPVSVSRWEVVRELKIIDLTSEFPPLNPFEEESLAWFEECYDLLYLIGEQMGTPLSIADDPTDYRPCQEAAARIRSQGFDGIRYQSAMSPSGTNLVLFDPAVVAFVTSRLA
jgi:hypothetical protein